MNRWLWFGAAALALLAGAFATGRYSAQGAEVREVERVVYRNRIVEKVVTKTVKEAAEVKRVVVYRERVTKPDGTKVETEVERTDTDTKTVETARKDIARDTTHEGKRDSEKTVSPHAPQWRVGALVGGQLSLSPLGATPVYGAHVERRIAGPFFVGAWGLHTGAAGVSLSIEF